MIQNVLQYSHAVLAAVLLAWGQVSRAHRLPLFIGAVFAGAGAFAAHHDAFWAMACCTIGALWGLAAAVDVFDLGWRMRFSLVMTAGALALLVLWPTLDAMTGGVIPCPRWVEERVTFRLVAGLDLRGGLRLVYSVDVSEAVRDKRDRYYEDMQVELAKVLGLHSGDERPGDAILEKVREKVTLTPSREDVGRIRLEVKDPAEAAKVDARFLERFQGELAFSRSDDQRVLEFRMKESVASQIRERAVGQAKDIVHRRIDEMGLREASVSTRDEDIIIEVPGEDEASFAYIRDIIGQTARLEFKLVDDETDFFGPIARTATPESLPSGIRFDRETVPLGVDESGEPRARANTYVFMARSEGETSTQALSRLKEWTGTLQLPEDRDIGYEMVYETDPATLAESEAGWRTFFLKGRAEITGDLIRDAAATPDQSQGSFGQWLVALTFTDQGGRIFERITGDNIKRRFAIILDKRIESAPVIQNRIPGGRATITLGSNDPEVQLRDARKLEFVLRSGALPAPITPSNEQRIGPSLGRDAIRLGVQGAAAGSILVLIFMVFYYRRAGLIADLAVGMNLLLQLAVLCSFNASMTLPGIAGLALTIGMSVDSNVLINERIRDELRHGKSPRTAVEIGYDRAFSAIIDGHLTTIISGVVLAQFGTGPIKGFAVTLIVGVIASVFTGVMVSRVMFDAWVRSLDRTAKLDVG
ncbi:MAG: protein translocase subunit SecD [Deltaproteobacteria bacterium]|nr:protein translocase subunit SecD [Deltaproteobacteria bacterium]